MIKRIAVICNYRLLADRIGGMDRFFWLFDQRCRELGYSVNWFFPNDADHGGYKEMNITAKEGQSVEATFLQSLLNNPVIFDSVYTHFVELSTPFFVKLSAFSGNVIAVDHNPRPFKGYSIKKRIEKRLKGILFSRYIDTFVSVSEPAKHWLANDFGEKVLSRTVVINNGIDIEGFIKRQGQNSTPRFIVSSHLRREKGIQDLIKAADEVRHSQNHINIDIYGDGPMLSELKALTEHFGLEDSITFKGVQPSMQEIYCNYDYLIHPSHGETFCYSVLESLICKVPVITTEKHGNILGLVTPGRNGFLFEAGNTAQLASILRNILEEKEEIVEFTNSTKINNYTIEKMVSNYMALIDKADHSSSTPIICRKSIN